MAEDTVHFSYNGPDADGSYTMSMEFSQSELPSMAKIKEILQSKTDVEVGSISRWVDDARRGHRATEHKVRGERSWAQLVKDWVAQKPARRRQHIAAMIGKIAVQLADDTNPDSQVSDFVIALSSRSS